MELQKAVRLFLTQYKASTQQAYRHALHPMRDRIGPTRALGEIKPEHVLEFVQEQITQRPRGRRPYSAATRRKLVRTVKIFFNWCVKMEMIDRSPARQLKVGRPELDRTRDKAMTDEELAALLDYFRRKTAYPRDFAMLVFLRDSGARAGGAAGLRLRDISWDALLADVTEKGEKTRKVAFSEECARAIRHWLAYRGAHFAVKGEYVFSRDGQRFNPVLLTQALHRACVKLGLRKLGTHSLRHRLGFKLNDHKVPLTVSAAALGNTPEVMRDYYSPHDWASAEKALRELMPGGQPAADKGKVITFPTDSAASG